MHLVHIITAERPTRALNCIYVASRIAGSSNPASRIPTIVIVVLEDGPILDVIGSAFVAA